MHAVSMQPLNFQYVRIATNFQDHKTLVPSVLYLNMGKCIGRSARVASCKQKENIPVKDI